MSLLRIFPALITLVLGLFLGTQLAGPPPTEPTAQKEEEGVTQGSDAREIAMLNLALEAAESRARELQSRLDRATFGEKESAIVPAKGIATAPFTPGGRGPHVISALGEAPAAFERACVTGDLEALWLLAADVLAFGEEGYPVFEELFAVFFEEMSQGRGLLKYALRKDELYTGRFLRTLAEQHEDFLAYGLDLVNRDVSEAPDAIQELQRELFDDDFLPVILAFHGGENRALTSGWLQVLERRMTATDQRGMKSDTLLFGLAQIPDDRAVDLIATYLENNPNAQIDGLHALIAHGSERALAVARQLLPMVESEQIRAAFEQALDF